MRLPSVTTRSRLNNFAANWVFILPTLIFFVGYMAYPIFRVLWISFTDYRYLSRDPVQWVGLLNYTEAFRDPLLYQGLIRAAVFTALFLPGVIIIPLFLAILVDRVRQPRLAEFYRVVLLIPAAKKSTGTGAGTG